MGLNFKFSKAQLILIGIIILAITIRLYFLFSTANQALWWDEAEYAVQARNFAGLTENSASILRPVLLPALLAPLIKFGFSELSLRFIEILFSVASIFLIYVLAKELTKKEIVSLLSAFLLAVFWMHLFYTNRLLTEIPSLTFLLAGAVLFLKSYKENKSYYPVLAGLFFAASFLTRFPIVIAIAAIALFVIITQRFGAFKSKSTWIALGAFIAFSAPFFIWAQSKFGDPIAPIRAGSEGAGGLTLGLPSFLTYVKWLPHYFSIPFLVVFLLGLVILFVNIILNYKNVLTEKQEFLLLALWLSFPVIFFSSQPHAEDRYLMLAVPAALILIAITLDKILVLLQSKSKAVAYVTLSLILLFGTVLWLNQADALIVSKADSFAQVKEAGLWLKENSQSTDTIFSASVPQLQFYAERNILGYPATEESFGNQTKEYSPAYLTVSVFERHPDWIYSYFDKNNMTPIKLLMSEGKPTFAIYVPFNYATN